MVARRFAMAFGIFLAVIASQLPEYTQQYRQRLGGAIDELKAIITQFDTEANRFSLERSAAIERLRINPDELARQSAADMEATVARETRLEHQQAGFATAGPVTQYWVLASEFDGRLGGRAYAAFQPAVPVTSAGLFAGLSGLFAGWGLTHAAALTVRRRRTASPAGHVRI